MIRTPVFLAGLLAALVAVGAAAPVQAATKRTEYDADYRVRFLPAEGLAEVEIRVTPGTGALRQARFTMPASRYSEVRGDGEVSRDGDRVTWVPPRGEPASFHYRYRINHQRRRGGGFDARITATEVLMRGDDLVPPAVTRTSRGADSRARLRFELPEGWTSVETPYVRTDDGKAFVVVSPGRRFDRPTGWLIAGAIGTRREMLDATSIYVSGPRGDAVRRNDMLAFFNGLVPEFQRAFGPLPRKLLIVSAGDPMWRGGLSGPRSLFLHADRPLISENGTSTLVHELTHVLTRVRGADGDDWIAEGLAEYYSIELMRRAGLLSDARADKAHDWMRKHGSRVATLSSDRSKGPRTARAVQLFADLDRELRRDSGGKATLDDLVRAVMPLRKVSREDLREQARALTGKPSRVLASSLLD